MTYEPGRLRRRSDELIHARNWGIGAITTLLGLGMFFSEIQRIRASRFDAIQCAYLGLFLLTGVLIFLWIWATQRELNLLFDWLDPERYSPPSSLKETLLILALALVLVGMLFASRSPLWFGVVFTTYSSVLIPATVHLNHEVAIAISRSRKRLEKDLDGDGSRPKTLLYIRGVDALDRYFLGRPITARLLIILVASGVATSVAIAWSVSESTQLGLAAYLLFIAIILSSEVVLGYWRCARDAELREIQAELDECERR